MKVNEVQRCSFSAWYPHFKEVSIKSYIIPIPQEFLDYLYADGVVLPEGSITACAQGTDEDDIEGEELNIDWESSEAEEHQTPSFPAFESKIKSIIKLLGGSVFPKLNWSAPRDATWVSFDRTLRCTCPSDIYLLLKSSDFICHDLTEPFSMCDDCSEYSEDQVKYDLILRKWQNLLPGLEFRCFVRNGKLIGISQRDHTIYYGYIKNERQQIVADIKAFHYHMVAGKFPAQNYVFDVYRREQGKLLLIDFNPFGEVTDSLLFTWKELREVSFAVTNSTDGAAEENVVEPEFRFLKCSEGVQPSPYLSYGVPEDIKDLVSGQDPLKFMDLLSLKVQKQKEDASTDEEGDG